MRVLGVTGATGYVGRSLLRQCAVAGWRVVAIGRRAVPGVEELRQADLSQAPPTLQGLNGVVHLAANTTGVALTADAELRFAVALAQSCRAADIPFVFVSSQTAAATAPSPYGRTKALIEDAIHVFGAIIIRPGQVIGGEEAGLFGMMASLARRSPLLPMLLPRPVVQPVHVDDVSRALLAALERRDLAGTRLSIAGDPVPFDELLMKVAHHRLRVRRLRMPIPAFLLRGALAAASRIVGPQLSPERLDSLTGLKAVDSRPDIERLGLILTPLPQALDRRSSLRRTLLLEGRMLARATIDWPATGLLRRYARLLPKLGVVRPLELPAAVLMSPALLATLDHRPPRDLVLGSLSWRLEVVTRLAESERGWAGRFIPTSGDAGLIRACLSFARAVLIELHVRLLAPWARRLSRTHQ